MSRTSWPSSVLRSRRTGSVSPTTLRPCDRWCGRSPLPDFRLSALSFPLIERGDDMMKSTRYSARLLFAGALALFSNVVLADARDAPGLTILVYHQIRTDDNRPADSPTAISLERFERQMRYLHEQGYSTLKSDEVVEYVAWRAAFDGQTIIAIHMDDGWQSGLLALPALDRYGFKASFWIISGTGIGPPHMDWEDVE